MLHLFRVPHARLRVHDVAVPPAHTLSLQVPGLHKVVDDPLGGSFGDPHGDCNVAQTYLGITLNREENLGVAGEEVPAAVRFRT